MEMKIRDLKGHGAQQEQMKIKIKVEMKQRKKDRESKAASNVVTVTSSNPAIKN